jgi:hypothetical protein
MTAMQELQSPAPSLQLQKTQNDPICNNASFMYLTLKLHNPVHEI